MIGWKSSYDEWLQFYGRLKLKSPDFLALFEYLVYCFREYWSKCNTFINMSKNQNFFGEI